MFDFSLFLGMPVNEPLSAAISKIDPKKLSLFISDNEESYLNEISFEGNNYIGKYASDVVSITDLVLLEKNIYSILNKLIPNYPCEGVSLVLFATPSRSK